MVNEHLTKRLQYEDWWQYEFRCKSNKTETVSKDKTSNTTGNVIHRGKRIDLNP